MDDKILEERIKEAIELLRENGYIVNKLTEKMMDEADKCAECGYGDCMTCSCFICAAGIE